MCPADNLETHLLTRVVCWTQTLKKCDFREVYDDEHFVMRYEKRIKLLRRVDRELQLQVNQIIRICENKDDGGWLWSKLFAEIPHLLG